MSEAHLSPHISFYFHHADIEKFLEIICSASHLDAFTLLRSERANLLTEAIH